MTILTCVNVDTYVSIRRIMTEVDIFYSSIRALKRNKWHTYKITFTPIFIARRL